MNAWLYIQINKCWFNEGISYTQQIPSKCNQHDPTIKLKI